MSEQDSSPPEGFRVIPGFPRFAIDEHGNVLSICFCGYRAKTNRPWSDAKPLKLTRRRRGYYSVTISHDGHIRQIFVHRLVLLTFVGPCPGGMQCRHLDGNPANNHISNLAWGSSAENHKDKILHGTSGKGEEHSNAKLKAVDVLEIRRRSANGESQGSIAKDFAVDQAHICNIVTRKRWKHI